MIAKDLTLSGGKRFHQTAAQVSCDVPTVTVITAVLDSVSTIRNCIESVISQDCPNLEHIVLDGGSSDGTLNVLRQYDDRIALWRSEPDHGIYDAWNKGLIEARGEWICFLGADDEFLPGAVSAYMALADKHPEAEFLSSVVRLADPVGRTRLFGESWQWPRFLRLMCTAHPGSMHRKSLFQDHGFYDTSYNIAGDYEFLLRSGAALKAAFLPRPTVAMNSGGLSDSYRALLEARRAQVETGRQSRQKATLELQLAILKRVVRKTFLGFRIRTRK